MIWHVIIFYTITLYTNHCTEKNSCCIFNEYFLRKRLIYAPSTHTFFPLFQTKEDYHHKWKQHENLNALSYNQRYFFRWKHQRVWGDSSTSEFFRFPQWWEDHTTSGQGSYRERSPKVSRFPQSLFLDVPGTATEQFRTCGFGRNSSSLTEHPKYNTLSDWNLLRVF